MVSSIICLALVGSTGFGQEFKGDLVAETDPLQDLMLRQLNKYQFADYKATYQMNSSDELSASSDSVLMLWRVGINIRIEIKTDGKPVMTSIRGEEKSVLIDHTQGTFGEVPHEKKPVRGQGYEELKEKILSRDPNGANVVFDGGNLPTILANGESILLSKLPGKIGDRELTIYKFLMPDVSGSSRSVYVWFDEEKSMLIRFSSDLEPSKKSRFLIEQRSFEAHQPGVDFSSLLKYDTSGLKRVGG